MYLLALIITTLFCSSAVFAQTTWDIKKRQQELQVEGILDDWKGIPALNLSPGAPGVQVNGDLGAGDLVAEVRGAWDDEGIYVALRWEDNRWDVTEISRREAVWISPDKRRRDRMLFFDNFKFQIRHAEYDYLIWTSPRIDEQGPHAWDRLLQGLRGMEMATASPLVYSRQDENEVTVELFLSWDKLRIKPKKGHDLPVILVVSDSDTPGRLLDAKLPNLKWVEWSGRWRLTE